MKSITLLICSTAASAPRIYTCLRRSILACEEYLFEHIERDEAVLMLYIDDSSVIIGKHQNPWKECDVDYLYRKAIPVVRRISGGGTVYHDRGNLNFSFIIGDKRFYDKDALFAVVLEALARCGVSAHRTERYDILVSGKKVSGNAYSFKKDRCLHHGTLLVDSDLSLLGASLKGMRDAVVTYAVDSYPVPVTNIAAHNPQADMGRIISALCSSWESACGSVRLYAFGDDAVDAAASLAEKYRSWEWTFGCTPPFSVPLELGSGGRIRMHVEQGRIAGFEPEGNEIPEEVKQALLGKRFSRTMLVPFGL